ncbi:MAG: PHB depolymerase family esterase [Aliishimia sp.]
MILGRNWVGAALLSMLAACSGQTKNDVTPSASVTQHFEGRSYTLFMPDMRQRPAPAVFILHAEDGSGAQIREASEFDKWAAQSGVIAVYPNGKDGWNDGHRSQAASVNDVEYLASLVDTLTEYGVVDPTQVYFMGISNGGGMAMRMACERPDLVAGIGVVATNETLNSGCTPAYPIPAAFFLGSEEDQTATSPFSFLTDQNVANWQASNGCANMDNSPAKRASRTRGKAKQVSFTGCHAKLGFYKISGDGHSWPSATDINASQQALDLWMAR